MYIEESVICNRVFFCLLTKNWNPISTWQRILSKFQIYPPLNTLIQYLCILIQKYQMLICIRLNSMTMKCQYIILKFKIALFCSVTSCLCMTKKKLKVSLIVDIEIGFPHNVNRSRYQNFTKVKASYSLLSLEIYFMSNIQVS